MNFRVLADFILEHELLSEDEIKMVSVAINDIKEMTPSTKAEVFRKSERIVADSQDLSWCIQSVKIQHAKLLTAYHKMVDTDYALLVRQGRPSSEAIHAELRMKNESLYEVEELLTTIENTIAFLESLKESMDKYLYVLKDKLKYD